MKLKTDEKGFTLLELLVGISIAAFVVGAASMTTITMMRLTPKTNNWAIALRQVQNAGYWISRDVQMSKGEIDDNLSPPEFLRLTVPYESGGAEKTVSYQFETLDDQVWLMRNDSIEGKTAIAQYISIPTPPDYDLNNRTLTFTITATSGTAEVTRVTREYQALQRLMPAPAP
jgi:prepilin-type N-terminal cleavage/methylation domain-containing protein